MAKYIYILSFLKLLKMIGVDQLIIIEWDTNMDAQTFDCVQRFQFPLC